MVIGDLDVGTRPDTLPPKEEILWMMLQDLEVVMKISTTLPCSIVGESVDEYGRSLSRYKTSPSTSHNSVDIFRSSGFIAMVTTEVDIGIIPSSFLHITMVD